jgi:hypothetical protein
MRCAVLQTPGLILLLIANILTSNSQGGETETDLVGNPSVICGLNCVYLFLKLNEVSVDYDVLKGKLPIGSLGTSMADIEHLIREYGLDVATFKVDFRDLPVSSLPCIAHIQTRANRSGGHYCLVLTETQKGLTILDGSYPLMVGSSKRNEMETRFDGYVICKRPANSFPIGWLSLAVALASILGLLVVSGIRARGFKHNSIEPPATSTPSF